jgi:Rod binding domain-containing protein
MSSGIGQMATIGVEGTLSRARMTPSAASDSRDSFAQVIARASTGGGTPEARAREGAEQLVATALVQPVLKQLRESNQAVAPFAPSQGERSFRSLMDAALAQRMVRSQHWPLVDRLARGMLKKLGVENTQEA